MSASRIVSGLLYLGCVLFAAADRDGQELFAVAAGVLVPVVLIWFPEEVNDLTLGMWWDGPFIDRSTPPAFIAGFGWLLLVLVVIGGVTMRCFS